MKQKDSLKKKEPLKKKDNANDDDADDDDSEFNLEDAFKYSSRHLMRVYPAGWRVGSGNYDPNLAWNMGASLAALNIQECDKPVWINQAKARIGHADCN